MVDFNKLRMKRMASRRNAKVSDDVENDDVVVSNDTPKVDDSIPEDDIPDELDMSKPTTNNAANGQYSSSDAGMSLEELDERGFDMGKAETERAKLNNPEGDWEKKDAWKFEKRVYAGDCMPGDRDPAGRTVFSFSGKPKARMRDGISYEPTLFLSISPDYRADQYKPDLGDGSYKRFLFAMDLYLDVKSEKCSSPRKLISFLENEEYVVRTANFEGSTRVVGLKKETGVQRRRA